MILLEEVPKTGILILTVYFPMGKYKGYFQNEARKRLKEKIPRIDEKEKLGLELEPLQFSLVRTISGNISRAGGVQWQFGYKNMTPKKFKILYENIKRLSTPEWWGSFDVLIASNVAGVD